MIRIFIGGFKSEWFYQKHPSAGTEQKTDGSKKKRQPDPPEIDFSQRFCQFIQRYAPECKKKQQGTKCQESGNFQKLEDCFFQSESQVTLLVEVSGKIRTGLNDFASSKSMEA